MILSVRNSNFNSKQVFKTDTYISDTYYTYMAYLKFEYKTLRYSLIFQVVTIQY